MSTAVTKASALKPEIRLAQAVSEFEAELSSEQKAEFKTRKLLSTKASPNSGDVMRLTAEIDRRISGRYGGQCFGRRFTNFLEGVQQFAALGDVLIGGSQNIIACGVWSLVRMTILSIINIAVAKYADKLSLLFMDIGRASPRHEALALLYPRSKKLRSFIFEYFIAVVGLCRHIRQFGQKSTFGQLASALNDAKLQAFRSDLDHWAINIKEESCLQEHQESSGFRAIFKKTSESSSHQHNKNVLNPTTKQIEALLVHLLKLQNSFKVRVCISIRLEPHVNLKSITERLENGSVLLMPDANLDIDRFITADLEHCLTNGRLVLGDPKLILEIEDALVKGSQGMFLWATLQIQSICGMKTDRAIREALADLPRDFSEIFRRILHKSGCGDRALQEKVLRLVLAACRPLTIEELREALSVTPGDATWDSSRVLNDVASALACCGCLLVVDEEEFAVSFVHHSVRQYILGGASPDDVSFTLTEAHRTMADIFVTYLGYGVFGTEIATTRVQPVQASRIVHASLGSSSTIANMAQKILRSRRQPDIDIGRVLAESRSALSSQSGTSFKFHAYAKEHWSKHVLHASFKDESIFRLARTLLRTRFPELKTMTRKEEMTMLESVIEIAEAYKTYSDSHSGSLLVWAVRESRAALIELLSRRSHSMQTKATNVGLLELSLGCLDLNARDSDGNAVWPLVAQYLDTNRGILNFDKRGRGETTLLHYVASIRHRDMVELLLGIDLVDANATGEGLMTPLSYAVQNNHLEVVGLMTCSAKVDVNAANIDGYTPLMTAVHYRQKDMVELLLRPGLVNVEVEGTCSRTPLAQAVMSGFKEIVELLLAVGGANVEARDSYVDTQLAIAVKKEDKDVVEVLLTNGKADVNARHSENETPLTMATTKNYSEIVKLVLLTGRANVEVIDWKGQTPLGCAVASGYKNVVESLLKIGNANANVRDPEGWTPFHWAGFRGNDKILELLLNTDKPDVNGKNNDGKTPKELAADSGYENVVKMFEPSELATIKPIKPPASA